MQIWTHGSLHLRCTPTFNVGAHLWSYWFTSGVSFILNTSWYKIHYGTRGSPSTSTLHGEFTRHCSSVPPVAENVTRELLVSQCWNIAWDTTKCNYSILNAAVLEMASHLTPFPCLASIWLVPFLFPLRLFIVLFINCRDLFPSSAHIHNALLGGHGARKTIAEFIESYKNITEFSEW